MLIRGGMTRCPVECLGLHMSVPMRAGASERDMLYHHLHHGRDLGMRDRVYLDSRRAATHDPLWHSADGQRK